MVSNMGCKSCGDLAMARSTAEMATRCRRTSASSFCKRLRAASGASPVTSWSIAAPFQSPIYVAAARGNRTGGTLWRGRLQQPGTRLGQFEGNLRGNGREHALRDHSLSFEGGQRIGQDLSRNILEFPLQPA